MAIDWLGDDTASMLRQPADALDLRSNISLPELTERLVFSVQRDLLQYWSLIRGDTALPDRSDFNPLLIPQASPFLGLIDIVEPGPQFRYRSIGAKLPANANRRLEGRMIHEHQTPAYADYLSCIFELPYRFRRPVFIRECAEFGDGQTDRFARLLLPLARDRNMPDMLLISVICETQDQPGRRWREVSPRSCRVLSMVSADPA